MNFPFDFFAHPNQMSSDHLPTICCTSEILKQTKDTKFDYAKANWRKYRQLITNDITELPIPSEKEDINSSVESFSRILLNAQRESIPKIRFNNKPQILTFTKQMIQFKNRLYRQMQRTIDVALKHSLKATINAMQRQMEQGAKHHLKRRQETLDTVKEIQMLIELKLPALFPKTIQIERTYLQIFLKKRTREQHPLHMKTTELLCNQSTHSIPPQT